uniref:SMAUG/ZCCHC2-like PHAT domain-containing protein n=1 Tax=Sphaeramia orbicularis TaxID=375764 RepID=A0A673BZ79_9TELE
TSAGSTSTGQGDGVRVPLELRFLGSYLEDLARKDYHVLRDFEFRANSPGELGLLSDVLSLLGSDSRECAGILFRILSHPSCGLSVQDTAVGPLEQLALLFTMASLHPAFHFHQREIVRGQLDKIELSMEEDGRTGVGRRSGPVPGKEHLS